jgi:hypothetical protein
MAIPNQNKRAKGRRRIRNDLRKKFENISVSTPKEH